MTRPRILGAALIGAATLAGCGIDVGKDGAMPKNTTTVSAAQSQARAATARAVGQRPPGVVGVDGGREDGITKTIVAQFNRSFAIRAVLADTGGETQGFQDLCSGRVDVVDAARTISTAEAARCRANGVPVANPITVGSDALVIATKNEADVGGDCATVAQVRDLFRAGSPITNWNQLGFFDLPLRTTGRGPGTDIFDFFAFQVLGVDNGATLAQMRGDFAVQPTDDDVRVAVTGDTTVARALAQQRVQELLRSQQVAAERRSFIRAAVAAADRRVLAEIAAVNRRNAQRKVRVDAAQLDAANRIEDARAKAAAASLASHQFDVLLANRTPTVNSALLAAQRPGTVGFFRFTYYEQFEEQLRPLEIQPGGTPTTSTNATAKSNALSQQGQLDCVFPSRTTITNATYPLARRIVLYATTASLKRPEVQTFLRYYLTQAQNAATADALVPITDQQRDQAITALTGRAPTRLTPTTGAGTTTTTTPTPSTTTAPAVAPGPVPGVAPAGVGATVNGSAAGSTR
jgi:ABC-type phosphate transport system substrate-binding protein